jgi:PleD family two-component response regulator
MVWSLKRGSARVAPPAVSCEISHSVNQSLAALGRKTGEEGASAQVLVVEDNAVNQQVAVMMLAKFGIRAEVAANGREGLEKLRAQAYGLVLMDCQMPEMNGYEATTQIRQLETSNCRVP